MMNNTIRISIRKWSFISRSSSFLIIYLFQTMQFSVRMLFNKSDKIRNGNVKLKKAENDEQSTNIISYSSVCLCFVLLSPWKDVSLEGVNPVCIVWFKYSEFFDVSSRFHRDYIKTVTSLSNGICETPQKFFRTR